MGPGRHADTFELSVQAVASAVAIGHFGRLVERNRLTEDKILILETEKAACLVEASRKYGLNETQLWALAEGTRSRLIGADQAPDKGNTDLLEFISLDVKIRALSSRPFFFGPLLFPEATNLRQADDVLDALRNRKAVLEGVLATTGALETIGYLSTSTSWFGGELAKASIAAACKQEMRTCEDAVEQHVAELDHCCVELKSRDLGGPALKKLKRLCTTLRGKVAKNLKLWTLWDTLDTDAGSPTLGGPKPGWEEAAAAHKILLLGTDASVSRTFPWDAPMSTGAGLRAPRSAVLKYLDIVHELRRSYEEFRTLLPYDLRRAVRYYELYAGDITRVLAKIREEMAERLAVLSSNAPKEEKALVATEVGELIFRRDYLERQRTYVEERRRQGRSAVANWYATGKPLRDDSAATTVEIATLVDDAAVVSDGEGDEEGQFVALPLLAAGGAARAAMLEAAEGLEPSEED